jgi:hypothetical protein
MLNERTIENLAILGAIGGAVLLAVLPAALAAYDVATLAARVASILA